MPAKRPVRLDDVARMAGVSAITVSRAIRDPGRVSSVTLEIIRSAIDQLGYIPNRLAGSLASDRSNLVVALIPNIWNPLFASTIAGLTETLSANGLYVAFGNTGHSLLEEERLVREFLAQRPFALVLHRTTHTDQTRRMLAGANAMTIEYGNLVAEPLDVSVSYSNERAARALAEHLIGRGYRRIAFVGAAGPERTGERQASISRALHDARLPFDAAHLFDRPLSFRGGEQAIRDVLGSSPGFDAVIFSGLWAAVGAVLDCGRRGVAIPRDIAIASFDDSELATQVTPALTVVRIPRYRIGRVASELIVARHRGEAPVGRVVDVGFEIVARDSA